ncbi:hypothetical protein BDA96_08G052500 [Sorghum bicolor]|jgi:hypothetical protein|uniref:Cystatin domain-containing protein n=2 Tax=Sorghum bicolor TaxID=4558 RepID=A0A921QEG3_SORBI|nr:hypothetical protein BDA96_08G052500 [Sorghum bicolor]KXG23040.1 hypothetical protein SORBI_3008G048600 [Sorghum bicolor]
MTTTMNTCSRLLVVAVVVVAAAFLAPSPATAGPYLCPWRTVAHPEDPFIQKLGSWVVDQQSVPMHFEKVESAKAQGVGQCTSMTRNYELILVASIRGTPGDSDDYKYRAVVYVINFTQPQKVISFGAIPPSHRSSPAPAN